MAPLLDHHIVQGVIPFPLRELLLRMSHAFEKTPRSEYKASGLGP
jgi:hypothetical protein